jgi:putative Mn2+ efflux pump MntP
MNHLEILLLALALSVDACVVSFSYGLIFSQNRIKNAFSLASFTAIFQGLMPCLGYFLTNLVKDVITPYASLTVCLIFVFLGLKCIKEALVENKKKPLCISTLCLFLIGIATSLDAFSAGISLALYGNLIFKPALLITFITFVNSSLGFFIGGKFKKMPTKYVEILAGIVLIFLGLKAII